MAITFDATYEDGVLKPAGALPLAEHAQVRVTVEEQVVAGDSAGIDSAGPLLADQIFALTRALPPGALDSLPDDLAAEHDHYLYGSPKRFE